MALLGSRDRNVDVHMLNEIAGNGQGDYDVPSPGASGRKVQQFIREKEIEESSESAEVLWIVICKKLLIFMRLVYTGLD